MINHMAIVVTDLARSRAFYAAALAPLGYRILLEGPGRAGFGVEAGAGRSPDPAGDFWVSEGEARPHVVHFAFSAASREEVDAVFAAAIAAGGTENGPPGLRLQYQARYYAGFILDPDGYNLEAVCHTEA